MKDMEMTLDEMISTLDGACGRLLFASMRDKTVQTAMEMVTKVSLALGEVDKITYVGADAPDGAESEG